ncbi:MAG: phage holin family protein [Bacteroidia bacterium]
MENNKAFQFITKLIISSIAVLTSAYILPGVHVENFTTALVVAAVLAFLNAFLKPLLIIFTIPFTVITLGLFLLVINAVIIIVTDNLIDGFEVRNFWWALLFSLILSLTTSVFEAIGGLNNNNNRIE